MLTHMHGVWQYLSTKPWTLARQYHSNGIFNFNYQMRWNGSTKRHHKAGGHGPRGHENTDSCGRRSDVCRDLSRGTDHARARNEHTAAIHIFMMSMSRIIIHRFD